MKIHKRSLASISLVLLLASLLGACQQQAAGPDDPVLLQDPKYIMGAGLFKRHCAGCHGEAGEGRTSLGPAINDASWQEGITDEHIREVILEGRRVAGTSMDSFQDMLSSDEIDAIIVYLRSLAR